MLGYARTPARVLRVLSTRFVSGIITRLKAKIVQGAPGEHKCDPVSAGKSTNSELTINALTGNSTPDRVPAVCVL
jgi:hypothetical protein